MCETTSRSLRRTERLSSTITSLFEVLPERPRIRELHPWLACLSHWGIGPSVTTPLKINIWTPFTTSTPTLACPSCSSRSCARGSCPATFGKFSLSNRPRQRSTWNYWRPLRRLEPPTQGDSILDRTSALFCPKRSEPIDEASLLRVAEVSQYAAWVVLHGASVNHFTSLINSHAVLELDSIEETVAALRAAGVPMKETIEGKPGSKLRQTATAAVDVSVDVRRGAEVVQVPWTYAYFELAERGTVLGAHGQSTRFEGFLGAQATELFEMTRRPSAGPSQS